MYARSRGWKGRGRGKKLEQRKLDRGEKREIQRWMSCVDGMSLPITRLSHRLFPSVFTQVPCLDILGPLWTHDHRRSRPTADHLRLSTSMQFYRSLLGIQSVKASTRGTSHLLHIIYDIPLPAALNKSTKSQHTDHGLVELILEFDPSSKRLVDAQVSQLSFR